MVKALSVAILMIATGIFSGAGHPYYLSVTELKYNATERALEGSVKIFVHDLETSLKKLGHSKIDLINSKDKKGTTGILSEYLARRFVLSVNGKRVNHEFVGFEHEGEHVWLHVSFKPCRLPGEVHIVNSILYDHFKEQMNIVHLDYNGKNQSDKLTNPDKEMRFVVR
jgi:hypothetical protein